ncbi:hypothetical protein VI35_03925 [Aeromonas caviae]|nr:hypothetical protein VI35_03925 [Aeromonas caviae]
MTEMRVTAGTTKLETSGTLALAPAAMPVKTSSSRARSTASTASWCWARMAMDVQRRQRPGAIQGLKAGETLTDTLTVTNADGKTTTTVTITINGTDDVPTLTPDVGSVTEDRNVQPGNLLQASGTLAAGTGGDAGEDKFIAGTLTASTASWCWARMASGRTAPTTARR